MTNLSRSIIKSPENIISSLISEGLKFKNFSLESSGEFHIDDVDWNYKDMLHATYVHKLLDPAPIVVTDFTIAQIFFQKFLIFRFPFSIYQYDSGPNQLAYFFTLFSFVFVVNTKFFTEDQITKVQTTYNIGSSPILLAIFFPLIKWSLSKNYRVLMSEDMPMRLRRGELRKMGANFKKPDGPYSFLKTININEENCEFFEDLFDAEISSSIEVLRSTQDRLPLEFLTGRSDAWGLRGVVEAGTLKIYPRLCTHEGACLDRTDTRGDVLYCPWHNKRIQPIVVEQYDQYLKLDFEYKNRRYKLSLAGTKLNLEVQ